LQPRAQVSSLQQLLALKNRVLMELQKHGIGGAPVATSGTPSAGGPAPVTAASSPRPAETAHASAAVVPVPNSPGMSQAGLSIAAAVGAALVVLLAALRMLRRKREAGGAAEAASADGRPASAPASDQPTLASRAPRAHDGESAGEAAALAGEDGEAHDEPAAARAADESAGAQREAAERAAAQRAAEQAAAEKAAAEQTAPERASAEQSAADRTAAETAAQEGIAEPAAGHEARADSFAQDPASPKQSEQIPPGSPVHAEPAHLSANVPQPVESASSSEPLHATPQEMSSGATTAASLAAAAELGAEALPLEPLEPVDETLQHDDPPRHRQWNDEPAHSAPSAQQEPATDRRDHPNTPVPVINFAQQNAESRTLPPLGQPSDDALSSTFPEPSTPAQPVSAAPSAFPRDAVDAFSSLNMPLPPRIDSPADTEHAATSPATQPAASPQDTAQHAIASQEPDDAPHIADEIAAGTAGHAALAGLGARGFGSLNLDFDLELPPSPAPPLPAFTQTDLIRIARNKLDLASEYIELGDLSGARTLINEVIEADDPATRTEARALLSTLAPLS
jgi:FimV-like protein